MPISRMQQPRQMYQQGGEIMPRLNQLGSGVSSAEQTLQQINQRLQSAESSLGEGGAMQTSAIGSGFMQPVSMNNPQARYASFEDMMKNRIQSDVPNSFLNLEGVRSNPDGTPYTPPNNNQLSLMTNQTPGGGMRSPLAAATGRQMYGLGSLVKKAVKGVTGAVKSIAKSDVGKAALLGVGLYGLPGGFGGITGILSKDSPLRFGGLDAFLKKEGVQKLGDVLRDVGIGTAVAGATDYLTRPEDPEARIGGRSKDEIENVISGMKQNYRNLGYEEGEIDLFIEDYVQQNYPGYGNYANGGRIGYAFGTPEDNAMRAAGIMNLPLNQNPAGVTELDLRETGGFIPPVGVKEKADDIPAMLSNNEFVMTADAVKQFGDGDVNKGAQRMYAMMKKLENGGRV